MKYNRGSSYRKDNLERPAYVPRKDRDFLVLKPEQKESK